jgi:hypothetical protein
MDIKLIVQIVVAGSIGFLIMLNVLLYFNNIEDDTVNFIIKSWAYNKYYFITFVWGVLGGHFFLGSYNPVFGSNWIIPPILLIAIVILLIYFGKKLDKKFVLKRRYQLILLITGVLYGHFFWAQEHLNKIDFPF